MHAVIFDFGNVVGYFDHRLAARRLALYSDLTAEDIYARVFGTDLEVAFESGRIGEAEFLHQLRRLCRLTCPDEVAALAYSDIFWPNQEVCDLLDRLEPGPRLLLASNTNVLHARHFRVQFAAILGRFGHLVLSHEVGARKPEADFFERCLALAQGPPAECLFIDDLAANVAGAIDCGLRGILYRGAEDLRRRLADLGVLPG